jgi:hypothetical protein
MPSSHECVPQGSTVGKRQHIVQNIVELAPVEEREDMGMSQAGGDLDLA